MISPIRSLHDKIIRITKFLPSWIQNLKFKTRFGFQIQESTIQLTECRIQLAGIHFYSLWNPDSSQKNSESSQKIQVSVKGIQIPVKQIQN